MSPALRRRRAARLPVTSRGCTTMLTLSIGRLLLEKLILAGEQLAHRLVLEHVLDGVGKDVGDGEDLDLGVLWADLQMKRIRDHDLFDRRLADALEGGPAEDAVSGRHVDLFGAVLVELSLIHISEPTRLGMISYAVFCLKKKK